MTRACLALLALFPWCTLVSCSDSPSSPSGGIPTTSTPLLSFAPGTTFTVLSGETGAPIAGARFVMGGDELVSNETGEVTIQREAPFFSPVDIVAAGYLDRNTSFKTNELLYTLWPKTSSNGLTEHSTAEIVYTTSSIGAEPILGQEPLRRWLSTLSQIDVVLGEGFDNAGGREVDTQIEAIAELNRVLPDGIAYSPPRFGEPPPRGYVEMRIKADYSPCIDQNFAAVATLRSGEYTSARITYCSESAASLKFLALHELGHTAGLRHSSNAGDLMYHSARTPGFQPRETLLLKLMYQRSGGNLFPDNERGSGRQSLRAVTELHCGTNFK